MEDDQHIPVDASRGTPLWAFNTFRSSMLSSLLNGLLEHEDEGLSAEHCREIKMFLGKLVNLSTELPDGGFLRGSIFSEMTEIEDAYIRWNDIEGTEEKSVRQRRNLLKKLRKRRKKISERVRHHQHVLTKELDLQTVDAIYEAVGSLVKAVPNLLTDLAKQFTRYERRKASAAEG